MQHLNQLPVLVLGLGASGLAMARWCARHGAEVTVADTREAPPQLAVLRQELPQVRFVSGPFGAALVEGTPIRAVYRSPGLSPADIAPVADAARAVGLVLGGELDLFAQALRDIDAERRAAYSLALEAAQQLAHEQALALQDAQAAAARVLAAQEAADVSAAVPLAAVDGVDVEAPEVDLLAAKVVDAGAPEAAALADALAPALSPGVPSPNAEAGREPSASEAPVAQGMPAELVSPEAMVAASAGSAPALTDALNPASAAEGVDHANAAPASTAETPTAPAPSTPGEASTPYVPHAAREAAEFVARIAELSTPAALHEEEEAPAPAPVTPVVVPPALPQGYAPAVLAITGTNGKTTVTSLTGQLVDSARRSVAVAGNIGPSLLDTLAGHLDADTLPEVWVLELSSFQLDGVQAFEPTAATVLNITQDHLDWHGDMASYAAAKSRVFGQTGLMVLNREDAAVMALLPAPVKVKLQKQQIRAHITFGADLPKRPGDFGIERVNGMAWLVRAHEADETQKRKRGAGQDEEIHLQRLMPADALRIRGQHNALNALAALALAASAGCALGPMLYGLREYRGEPHRVESVALIDDVEYFDDSKGTNVGATAAALLGLGVERKLVVILGGEGKGQDFGPLAEPVSRYVRTVVLIGRDAPLIEAALADTGVPLLHAPDMDTAVRTAAQQARAGDAVLLSPACASFDMFRNYGHRAEVFVAAVQALADDPEPQHAQHGEGEAA